MVTTSLFKHEVYCSFWDQKARLEQRLSEGRHRIDQTRLDNLSDGQKLVNPPNLTAHPRLRSLFAVQRKALHYKFLIPVERPA